MSTEILLADEVAALLRVNVFTVYRWAEDGTIPATKLGGTWRFRKSQILNMFQDKGGMNGVGESPGEGVAGDPGAAASDTDMPENRQPVKGGKP